MNLKSLSDDQLLEATEKVVEGERRITAEAIKHFFELNRRRLYLDRGYGSLFDMLTKKYRYCAPTAMLRINAVRLMTDVPDVIAKIESGEMPVTVVANIQSFLNSEAKCEKAYSTEAKIELIETCVGKSVLEVQKEFVRRNPEIEKRESVRATSDDRLRVSHSISADLEEKLQRIKMLWSHIDPNMSREDLLDQMAELTLDQIDPLRKAERANVRERKVTNRKDALRVPEVDQVDQVACASPAQSAQDMVDQHEIPGSKRTRYIHAADDRKLRERNAGSGCEFVDEKTGQSCGSHFQLQRDHIEPWSQGGSNNAHNLRMYRASHNRWRNRNSSRSYVRAVALAYG